MVIIASLNGPLLQICPRSIIISPSNTAIEFCYSFWNLLLEQNKFNNVGPWRWQPGRTLGRNVWPPHWQCRRPRSTCPAEIFFKSKLKFLLGLGLVTSCYGCDTVCWKPPCFWLRWGPMVLIAHFSGLGFVGHPPFVVWEVVSLIIRVGANYVSFIFHNKKGRPLIDRKACWPKKKWRLTKIFFFSKNNTFCME